MDYEVKERFPNIWKCSCHDHYHSPDPNTPAFKSKIETSYWHHGLLHREDGPAYYYYEHKQKQNGEPIVKMSRYYYIHGNPLGREQFIRRYEFVYMKPYTGE